MRIVTGVLKGRIIPFNPSRYGGIKVTSAKLKEALFSALGGGLEGQTFLDLCAGSGQISLEAYSRGASVTVIEPDPRRLAFLRKLFAEWGVEGAHLLGVKAQTLIPQLQQQATRFDTIYLDPPYDAQLHGAPLSISLIEQIAVAPADILSDRGMLAVQHHKHLELPETQGRLARTRQRVYGDTILSQYETVS